MRCCSSCVYYTKRESVCQGENLETCTTCAMGAMTTSGDAGTHTAQARAIVTRTITIQEITTAFLTSLFLKPIPVDRTLEERIFGHDIPTLSKVGLGLIECLLEKLFSCFLHAYIIPSARGFVKPKRELFPKIHFEHVITHDSGSLRIIHAKAIFHLLSENLRNLIPRDLTSLSILDALVVEIFERRNTVLLIAFHEYIITHPPPHVKPLLYVFFFFSWS